MRDREAWHAAVHGVTNTGKDGDAGKDRGQEDKGTREDKMVG